MKQDTELNQHDLKHARVRLTDTLGQPLAPLGCGWVSIVAGQEAVARQLVAFIADELHGGSHVEAAACDHLSTVSHVPGVLTRHNWCVTRKRIVIIVNCITSAVPAVEQTRRRFRLPSSHLGTSPLQVRSHWHMRISEPTSSNPG